MKELLNIALALVMLVYYIVESIVIKFIPLKYRQKSVKGEIVLITGAGGGIGRMLALGFANLGCKVVCWDVAKRANEETVRLVRMSKGEAFAYQVDLTNREEIYRTAERVKREIGKVTILINNAGVVTGKSLLDCSDDDIKRTFDVNTMAHFWTAKAFLPDMIMQDKGHIVTVASLAGMNGIHRLVDYCSSKFAAVGFDESLRVELQVDGRKGVKTTVVCPYFVRTPLFDGINSKILPVLEPDDVARETISAVLCEEKVLLLPKYLAFFIVLKAMIPIKSFEVVLKLLKARESMETFKGGYATPK